MRITVHRASDAVPTELGVHGVARFARGLADYGADVTDLVAGTRNLNGASQGKLRGGNEFLVLITRGTDDGADGGIADPAVDAHRKIETDEVAVFEAVLVRQIGRAHV